MRVSTRLVAIVVIPVVGLVGFSAREASARWNVATGAAALTDDVERVSTLTPVALMVAREMFLNGAIISGRELGLDLDTIGETLGLDLEAALRSARQEVDRRLAQLEADDPAQTLVDRLAALRIGLDDGTVTLQDASLWDLSRELSDIAHTALIAAQARALGLVASTDAQGALLSLDASYDAASAVFAEIGALGRMVVGDDDFTQLAELHRARALLEVAHAELDRVASDAVADDVTELLDDPVVEAGATAMGGVLASGGLGTTEPTALAALFGGAMERLDAYYSLVLAVAADAATDARSLGDDARQRALLALSITGLLLLATLAATALIARSIGRPLRRLTDGAEHVRAGILDDVDLPMHGPREIVGVTRTLREVVANLQVVEAQLGALDAGRLEDPVLAEPVPGRIGASLHGSVARLSRSIHEREELSARLEHEATHDGLTGLPNRSAAGRELARALARGRRRGNSVGVLYIDLDDFKHVNDNHGHEAGDIVLQIIAKRLLSSVRAGDFVARLGGDEFLVITEQTEDARDLVELGDRVVAELAQSIALGAVTTRVGASVGVSLTVDLQVDADALLREADLAAYEAKANGRGRVEIFDDALRASIDHQSDVEHALRAALGNDELELYFQPVVDARDGRTVATEALIRWNRPGHGVVLPGEFIPVAEGSDLIIDVGRWVLHTACAHLAMWAHDPVLGELAMAVNLSGRHALDLTVVADVRGALAAHGVSPDRLVIEITETALITDLPLVGAHLSALRCMGVRVSLDDFGTGYTSLSHLRSLPVDVLKIDRSLVESGIAGPDRHVLDLVAGIAHSLGLVLVAEGIETEEQLTRMQVLGCDQLQGYLLGRPAPVSALRGAIAAVPIG